MEWLELQFPRAMVHHCRNEINFKGKTFQRELAKAKKRGAKAGFPDLMIIWPDGAGVSYLEVKPPKGYPSKVQKEMHAWLRENGYEVAVVRSIDDAREALREWGRMPKAA